ncbi:MAG: hypothetical protein PW735_02000 [Acidobacteriaceae bacterium]|nr:hypothetical protein [Acidobacteriaceae bacterium]
MAIQTEKNPGVWAMIFGLMAATQSFQVYTQPQCQGVSFVTAIVGAVASSMWLMKYTREWLRRRCNAQLESIG